MKTSEFKQYLKEIIKEEMGIISTDDEQQAVKEDEDDVEPSKSELRKIDQKQGGDKEKLALVTKEMRRVVPLYQTSDGDEKQAHLHTLKKLTVLKKTLEKKLFG